MPADVELIRVASGRAEFISTSADRPGWRAVWLLDLTVLPPIFEAAPLLYARGDDATPIPSSDVPPRVRAALREGICPTIGAALHEHVVAEHSDRVRVQLSVLRAWLRDGEQDREPDDYGAKETAWRGGRLIYPSWRAVAADARDGRNALKSLTADDFTPTLTRGRHAGLLPRHVVEAQEGLRREGRRASDTNVGERLGVNRGSVERVRRRYGLPPG